ncbi:MAG TPA: shikimate dehydrogenase [Solirubrobacteraceae bacterium]|nr:shikimate dehydrogenase [Solirubrobacteraceae bacterium]
MPKLGVIGWPIAHSRSPAMFRAAFEACAMRDWSYQALPLPEELFEQTVRALGASGFLGANVTIPHKHAALELADQASAPAHAIGAANTLTFGAGETIEAHNTDAPGLIAALGRLTGMPAHPSVLVLGAGGSARAAVWALQDAGAASVSVWNRSHERARELAQDLGADAVAKPLAADLLINCTSVGLQRSATEAEALNQLEMTADHVGRYAYVIDLVYGDGPTPLLAAAQAHGAVTVGGLEVLVAQGALSFEHWTGRAAPREAMRRGAGIEDATG